MNEMTLFLAQIFGPVLGFMGLGMLINQDFYMKSFKTFSKEGFAFVATVMAMIAVGVVLVMKHFLWTSFPEILVSIICLGFLIKGVLLAVLPKTFDGLIKMLFSKGIMMFGGFAWFAGGAYLSYVGFFA